MLDLNILLPIFTHVDRLSHKKSVPLTGNLLTAIPLCFVFVLFLAVS